MIAHFNGLEIEVLDKDRQPCEIWSRVMGYYRPVESWNMGKRQEFKDRVNFKLPNNIGKE